MRAIFKDRLWLVNLPVVVLFAAAFWIVELGSEGQLDSPFLMKSVYPTLSWIGSKTTDAKFLIRGKQKPKNPKIVIVDIDELTVTKVNENGMGRWPWHRDLTARLIENTFGYGAKYVGLDIVFAEADPRVSPEVRDAVAKSGSAVNLDALETDSVLGGVVAAHKDNLVLAWFSPVACRPAFEAKEDCDVGNIEAIQTIPATFPKFAFSTLNVDPGFDPEKTAVLSAPVVTSNLASYEDAGGHAGFFTAQQDPDGVFRRSPMLMMVNGQAQPPLALEMAKLALGEELRADLDSRGRVKWLGFAKSGREIPVSGSGMLQMNVRGGRASFDYVNAYSVLFADKMEDGGRALASIGGTVDQLKERLKDAYVFIGTSAIGSYDLRNFSFESNVPGVEAHATMLDNILAGDALISSARGPGKWVILFLMVVAALALAFVAQKIEAIPALLLFVGAFFVFGFVDVGVLFRGNHNWNTGYFYVEMSMIFGISIAAKYIVEERNKRFLRGAFSKYVAPAIVDSILEDPDKLNLGGEKKDLTILFSDIRGFTTFSEKLDAKVLSSFLNDYLGIMTDVVFAHGGTLDKYIGDAVMAFWGAPLEQKDHAGRASAAARKMLEALDQNKRRFQEQYGVDVEIGIGLNSGTVSVGNMGCEKNFEYTVIGDNVNLASRLEGLTKEYRAHALATRATLDMIRSSGWESPPHRVLDFVKVKGKKVAVELIEILEKPLPPQASETFQAARAAYSARRWDDAIALFRRAQSELGSEDGPCAMFIERCEEIKKDPREFGPEWDGAWVMHSK